MKRGCYRAATSLLGTLIRDVQATNDSIRSPISYGVDWLASTGAGGYMLLSELFIGLSGVIPTNPNP